MTSTNSDQPLSTSISFGCLLKLRRREAGLEVAGLAKQVGFSIDYIKKLESGARPPIPATAEALARALGLDGSDREELLDAGRRSRRSARQSFPDGTPDPRKQATHRQNAGPTVRKSYDALPPALRSVMVRLAVFDGGFTSSAAKSVCWDEGIDIVQMLNELVQVGVIERIAAPPNVARYFMVQAVREFGRDHFGVDAWSEVQARHAEFFLWFVQGLWPQQWGPGATASLDALEAEHDNLRAAIGWLLEQRRRDEASLLAGSVGPLWQVRGHYEEGRRVLETVLPSPGKEGRNDIRSLYMAGLLAFRQSAHAEASAFLNRLA